MYKLKFMYGEPRFKMNLVAITDENGNVDEVTCIKSNAMLPRPTVCSCYDTKEQELRFGVTLCSSKDVFSKSTGRAIAAKRAIENPVYILQGVDTENLSDLSYRTMCDIITNPRKYVVSSEV